MTMELVLEAMTTYGGSFVRGLADLYRLADDTNRRLLEQAFEHYFVEYREMAALIPRRTDPR